MTSTILPGSTREVFSFNQPRALSTILCGGLTVGVLDGLAAVILSALRGVSPARVFQYIASGLLGRASFNGGFKTVLLGVLLHFLIAFGVATVFYFASLRLPALTRQAVLSGVGYGVIVYFVMQYVVLPLSAIQKGPFSFTAMLRGLIVHMICVGLPVALIARRSAKES